MPKDRRTMSLASKASDWQMITFAPLSSDQMMGEATRSSGKHSKRISDDVRLIGGREGGVRDGQCDCDVHPPSQHIGLEIWGRKEGRGEKKEKGLLFVWRKAPFPFPLHFEADARTPD